MYQHPGVYIEEIPSGSRPIESTSTSTALIVGYATKGPLDSPTLVLRFDQYVNQFGGVRDFHGVTLAQNVDYMGHTVEAFFRNGGSKAYIVRLAGAGHQLALAKLIIPVESATTLDDIDTFLQFKAMNSGTWANGLEIRAEENGASPVRYSVSIGRTDANGNFETIERYDDVSLDPADSTDFIASRLTNESSLVMMDPITLGDLPEVDKLLYTVGSLSSGDLSGLSRSEIELLDEKKFKVTLKPGTDATNIPVTLNPATTLEDLAADIQSQVRGGTTSDTNPRKLFTCSVEGGQLVLRSGVKAALASVAVAAGTPAQDDAAATLKLLEADGATSQTGAEAFLATFSTSSSATLGGGTNGSLPTSAEYKNTTLMAELRKISDISVILLPGQTWSATDAAGKDIIDAYRAHAERVKTCMVIVDPAKTLRFTSGRSFLNEGFPTSNYTVTYYPWLDVANPHFHPELRADRPRTVQIPPSGFAAGLWAKTDGQRGVWKAPAGLQTGLVGAASVAVKIGNDEQDQLNPVGVNCYRRIISDIVVWGSRTLATKADPEWRYVPIRRTAIMIERSIYEGIQWAVFEANDHRLWSSLRLNIEAFMDSLFRAGAFQGEKASDAFFVNCGLGSTMTQADIDAGQVIVKVGFAPLKPAEFVIVRIQQKVGQQ